MRAAGVLEHHPAAGNGSQFLGQRLAQDQSIGVGDKIRPATAPVRLTAADAPLAEVAVQDRIDADQEKGVLPVPGPAYVRGEHG